MAGYLLFPTGLSEYSQGWFKVSTSTKIWALSILPCLAHWLPAHLKMTPGIPSILFLIPIEVGRKTEKKTKAFPVPGNLSIFEGCPKKPQEDFPIQLIAQSRQMTNSTYKKVSWEMIWWFLSSPEKKMKNCCIWCHATIPPTSVQW